MTIICLRLVHPSLDGAWMDIDKMPPSYIDGKGQLTPLVTTGTVEWEGDKCAEVYIPEDKMLLWRRNHALDI